MAAESTGSFDLPLEQKVGVGHRWEGNMGALGVADVGRGCQWWEGRVCLRSGW